MVENWFRTLFRERFPYQLPDWFSKIIAAWAWCIVLPVIVVQPWIGWGYWEAVHTHGASVLNGFTYVAFFVSALEIILQLFAVPRLRRLQRSGWDLLYYSAFLNIVYGIVRIFSNNGSIGPLFGMVLLSVIFFYFLSQVQPYFTRHHNNTY